MKSKIRFLLAAIMLLAGTTNARAQQSIEVNEDVEPLISNTTCTHLSVTNGAVLIVNQGVTLTLSCVNNDFELSGGSTIELAGTMIGYAGSDTYWEGGNSINVYLSNGAKYMVSGLSCEGGDSYLHYIGYDAGTDGHGTVTVTDNGSNTVTSGTLGYRTTTYTFTATPNSGYRFVNWTKGAGGEVLGTAASIAVTCQENGWYQVYANFEEVPVRTLTGVPQGWQVQAGDPLTGVDSNADGSYSIAAGQPVLLVPSAEEKARVKSVTLVEEAAESDPLATPLTMEALTDGTVVVDMSGGSLTMKYSKNGGAKTTITATTTINVAAGDKVQFYGDGTNNTAYIDPRISGGTASVKVYGNVMSLVDEENFATATELSSNAFQNLFDGNLTLTDASELLLPATTLEDYCYSGMFRECSALTTAPALPATTLAYKCYKSMFMGCSALTTAPALPATMLAESCYSDMFVGCSALSSVTCLATSIDASGCLDSWLIGAGYSATSPTLHVKASMGTADWNNGIFTVQADQ